MKIAFFVHGYLPWDAYGVPRYIERLSIRLASKNHTVYIICVGRKNLPKIEKPHPNIVIYRTKYVEHPLQKIQPYWSLASYTFGSLLEVSRLIKKEGIQVIHGHTDMWGGFQASLVSKITGIPFIITLHGVNLDRYQGKGKMPSKLRFLNRANYIICQKASAQQKLTDWGIPKEKIVYLPKGCIDTKQFSPRIDKSPNSTQIITFIGRLAYIKGPDLLLKATPKILSKKPSVTINFVGEGELKDPLTAKVKSLGISENVKFLGFRSDVDKILKESAVFVSLSPFENSTDLALLEAMSTGVPVVVTNVGEIKKIINDGQTGLLVKRDSSDVAEKILSILNNDTLSASLSANERSLVLNNYSLDEVCKTHEKIYESLVKP